MSAEPGFGRLVFSIRLGSRDAKVLGNDYMIFVIYLPTARQPSIQYDP